MKKIKILDKQFQLFISASEIAGINQRIAKELEKDLAGKDVIFIPILNGAFIFAADLLRRLNLNCQLTFLKLASYSGESSTGKVKELIGINEKLTGKTVVIVEDIIDTGITIHALINKLKEMEPDEIKIVSLFYKPGKCVKKVKIDYMGRELEDRFIVGYGLDYNGFGRNYPDVYQVVN